MKSVLTATAVILAFASQTFAFNLSAQTSGRSLNCYSQQTGAFQLQFGENHSTYINGARLRSAQGGGLIAQRGQRMYVQLMPDSSVILKYMPLNPNDVSDYEFLATCQ